MKRLSPFTIAFLLLSVVGYAQTTKIKTQPVDQPTDADRQQLQEELAQENRWDDSVGLLKIYLGPEANRYHSTLVDQYVHPLRNAMRYAADLLNSGLPAYQPRAFRVIERVISHQDQDTTSETYGIWPYHDEEPLSQMIHPDWNWADFIGVSLLEIYVNQGEILPVSLKNDMRTAIIHAARSIQQRDIPPDYTNIAIMGTFVTYLAAHLFALPDMQLYADTRLERFYDYTVALDGFAEYNSPTYTRIALDELVRLKKYLLDPEALRMVEACYHIGWQGLARHFHPPTGQLVGPHSRSYATLLRGRFYDWLYGASGGQVQYLEAKQPTDFFQLPHQLPNTLIRAFQQLPQASVSIDTFALDEQPPVGYSYLHPDFAFTTVSRADTWEQRRPYLAYWGTVRQPRYLRVRLLHDSVDFAAGQIFTDQRTERALTALCLATDGGDYHPSLDRLSNGRFDAQDLRLRFEVSDPALFEQLVIEGEQFFLRDGPVTLRVKMLAATFGKRSIRVKKGQDERSCWVDWIIHTGAKESFRLEALSSAFFAWATLFSDNQLALREAQLTTHEDTADLRWEDLHLRITTRPNTQQQVQNAAIIY